MGPGNDHSHGVWGGGKLCFWQKKMKERLHIWHGNKTTIKGIRVCIPPFALKHFFFLILFRFVFYSFFSVFFLDKKFPHTIRSTSNTSNTHPTFQSTPLILLSRKKLRRTGHLRIALKTPTHHTPYHHM